MLASPSKISERLTSWYRTNKRSLPWRDTKDPYRIWIAEVMLQQTQADRAAVYYANFLKRFPNIQSLANARWATMLSVWRGLGYYSRARNLIRAAQILVEEHRSQLPKDLKALQRLPGIGPYTAAAIGSFAFGMPVPALDTNLRRVLSRISGRTDAALVQFADQLFSSRPRSARVLNHALMDVGATLCKSRKIECGKCPLKQECSSRRYVAAKLAAAPSKPKSSAQKVKPQDVAVACIHRDGRYLICKRRKKDGGNWEFPGGKREHGESVRSSLKREIQEELGVEVSVRPPFLVIEHRHGKKFWRLHFCRCQILKGIPKKIEHTAHKWITARALLKHPFPKANRLAVKKLIRMR